MKDHPVRIIQVIADATLSGGPRHVLDLLEGYHASRPNWELHVVCPEGWLATEAARLATIHTTQFGNALNPRVHARVATILQKLVTTERPTLIHLQGVRAGIIGSFVIKKLSVPPAKFIYTEHRWTEDYHLTNPLRERLQLWFLRRASRHYRTIAVSQAVSDFLQAKKIATDVTVIPNGVPIPTDNLAKQNHYQTETYLLGTIGSLLPIKGFDVLLEAMPLILQNLPKTRLEIVGSGPEERNLRDLAHQLKIDKAVIFAGNVADVAPKLTSWDVFVSTSVTESFGLAIGQAMAAGLPVVASRSKAIEELITSETGRLVPPLDAHELAKVVIDLLPQANLRARLGQAGRQRIIDHFSLGQMVEKTITLYEDSLTAKL